MMSRFRKAAESIVAMSSVLDRDLLDDEEGRQAYKAIGTLLKQVGDLSAV
jgi:hypothetical protein